MRSTQTLCQGTTLAEYATPDEINLPIDLLEWVAKDKVIKFSVLKTYLYIKLTYPDHFHLNSDVYKDIATGLKTNPKTVKSHIAKLLGVKFMGFDKKTNTIWAWSKYKSTLKSKEIQNIRSKYLLVTWNL